MMVFVLIGILAGGTIYFLLAKERKRKRQVDLREAEFLAAARGNARPGASPLVGAGIDMGDTVPGVNLAHTPEAPCPLARPQAAPEAPIPSGALCGLCGNPVNAQAIDEAARAIRLPLSGSDKLAPYHAKCVATRMRQADGLQDKLADVVEAFDALHDAALPAASGQSAEERLRNSVNVARRAIGGRDTDARKEA